MDVVVQVACFVPPRDNNKSKISIAWTQNMSRHEKMKDDGAKVRVGEKNTESFGTNYILTPFANLMSSINNLGLSNLTSNLGLTLACK